VPPMNRVVRGALLGSAFLLAACGAGPAAPTIPTETSVDATPTAAPATATIVPTPSALASEAATAFTTDDVAIAKVIKDSADAAVAPLGKVATMSLEKQLALFQPAIPWIKDQVGQVQKLSPSGCTEEAVGLFKEGMRRYQNLAQDFLDWREWGAAGLPYTLSVPKRVAKLLSDAVVALEAHCPLPA
jgi:hypothetical protein